MTVKKEYRPTMFDKHGPGAAHSVRAWAYGLLVFGLTVGAFVFAGGASWYVIPAAAAAAFLAIGGATFLSTLAGNTYKHVMVSGATTPYTEQYSYQQSLVMKGEIDAALASFETVISSKPQAVSPRVKAAELYTKEKKNHRRAMELFREIQRIPGVSAGDYVYATNRIVDLMIGPVNEPGKARVELRKLIDKFPDT
ncbi:MAG: hypothetical protein ABI442_13855, partial [Gemmatimonadaceae bacterium]